MGWFTQIINTSIIIFFSVGLISGVILMIDRFFLVRRYPYLAGSCMYDLLLQDTTRKLELTTIRKKKAREILMLKYDVNNKFEAIEFIENFLEHSKLKDYSTILNCLNNNESFDEKSDDILYRFNNLKSVAINEYRFIKDDFKNIKNISAYKYANMGYVVKLCYKSKYISEKRAVNYLKAIHTIIEDEYDNWLDYSIAFITGKVIKTSTFEDELLNILDYLNFNEKSLWNKVDISLDEYRSFKDFEY